MEEKVEEINKIILCQWEKFSCFGCCGHDFTSEEEIRKEIKNNTDDFERLKNSEQREEEMKELKECGICLGIILKMENGQERVVCGLHPRQNGGADLRDSICQKSYFCKTMLQFKTFDEAKKKRFLEFLKGKNPDWYEYSIKMDNDTYLEEFLNMEKDSKF